MNTKINLLYSKTIEVVAGLLILLVFSTCSSNKENQLFLLHKSASSGIAFNNEIFISDSMNTITFEYIYNGGGAAVGDVNNDGLKDLFFAGNMVSSRLYLNKGDLKFEDITERSGTLTQSWCTGVSFVDINDDGLLDIYVCVAGLEDPEQRKNIFFINQGIDSNGIPQFENQAHELGLDDDGYSTMGVFFDYDKDDDLDMYLLTNTMAGSKRNMLRPISVNGEEPSTDRFYINNGDQTFTNWSREAGVLIEGFGLGVALCDINQDNWIDVYCANDFISNDLLWINNQDGTFSEQAGAYFSHFTSNGMGMDIADYNNDALLDVAVLDMMPITNLRQKLMFAFRDMDRLHTSVQIGYLPQFMRNTLQLNMGKFPDGQFHFSEIGYLAGIYHTDWSWAPLMVDFDNDGWKDMLITNGYRKDVTNLDHISEIIRETKFGDDESNKLYLLNALNKLEDVKLPNHIFRNNGDLTFDDKSMEWGLNHPTFTNGTVTADLDNDGDVDIVLNNMDQEVYLYENILNEHIEKGAQNHFLTIRLDPKISDSDKIGAKIWVFQHGNNQYFEYSPYRGYKSTVDGDIHVGIGLDSEIDSLIVQWPDGKVQRTDGLKGDATIVISKSDSGVFCQGSYISQFARKQEQLVFNEITDSLLLNIKHSETVLNDFRRNPSLLRNLSKNGPSISVGDVNQDGLDDVFLGNDKGKKPVILKQTADHTFSKLDIVLDSLSEDVGSLLFDADNDGDLDVYVVSGGSAWKENNIAYQDRLYFNDGLGNFSLDSEALPEISASGSCVTASDYDQDGDLDLFVGGRFVPYKYPTAPQSYLLENIDGKFIDKSDKLGKNQGALGMVTSALWTDINNDHIPDLMVVGEWMQITVLINMNGSFLDRTDDYNLSNSSGWWNSINGGDFDNDGDIDYLVGNYGLNSFYKTSKDGPLEIYGKDFDHNGTFDPVITNYVLGESYMVHTRNVMIELIPSIANRFMTYEEYGNATFQKSFTKQELEGAIHLDCKMMQSVLIENIEGKRFEIHELPVEVQFSPVFGSLFEDFNNDNRLDIMLVGNSMADETFSGYYDASYGNVLINKGDFEWEVLEPSKSKFIADGDKKALVRVVVNNKPVYLISENDGFLKAFSYQTKDANLLKLQPMDWYFYLDHNGLKRKVELYYGAGFLSSSSRTICIPADTMELEVFNFQGDRIKRGTLKPNQ